jgi:hypothetical protein
MARLLRIRFAFDVTAPKTLQHIAWYAPLVEGTGGIGISNVKGENPLESEASNQSRMGKDDRQSSIFLPSKKMDILSHLSDGPPYLPYIFAHKIEDNFADQKSHAFKPYRFEKILVGFRSVYSGYCMAFFFLLL